jgi:rare lipoprotein A
MTGGAHAGLAAALVAALVLAGCAGRPAPRPPPSASLPPPGVKIGRPYQVAGIWYYPADDRGYAETGIASWYGPGFHARNTANGEIYDQDDVTAAHRTLPMPSWVEVENLDNGRRLTVRINDRGPFVGGRIIDLSRRSAQLLGVDRAGTARVRVRRVYPTGAPPTAPALPPVVAAAAPPPPAAPAPALPPVSVAVDPVQMVAVPASLPVAVPAPAVAGPQWLVQVAALGDAGRAAWLKGFLAGFGPVVTEIAPGGLVRVRLGPYASAAPAQTALARVRGAGYGDARLIPPATAR